MDEKNELVVNDKAKLNLEATEITNQIISEKDPSKIDDLTQLFLLNKKKKDLVRINKLSNLIDVIDDEVIARFEEEPESFDNDQLIKYMSSTQQIVNSTLQGINSTPAILINNQKNEIHINDSGLNRESRAKVLEVIDNILKNNPDIIDIEEGDNQ